MNPLAHTRILDLTRLLPGAVCTMLLRGLGAEIIKVEHARTGPGLASQRRRGNGRVDWLAASAFTLLIAYALRLPIRFA